MIRLKTLLFEQTGTTTIKVGGADVVGTSVNNTQSKNDPWTYFISSDSKYYTTKKATPNAWKDLSTSLSPANSAKAKQRIDAWKAATPAAATPQTATGADNPVVTGGDNPVVTGGDNPEQTGASEEPVTGGDNPVTKTESKISINQIDSLPTRVGNYVTGKLEGKTLTFTDTEKRVIDLTGVDNLGIIPSGTYMAGINDATGLDGEEFMFMVKKEKRMFRKPERLEPKDVYNPAGKKYIFITTPYGYEPDETFCIVKTKDGNYKAFYVD